MKRLALPVLLLMLAACGSAVGTTTPTTATTAAPVATAGASASPSSAPSASPSTAPAPSAPGEASAIEISVKDFTLTPKDVTVSGTTVTLAVTNEGPTPHNIAVRDDSGKELLTTRNLGEGESETVSAELAPGSYILFCSLPGHESLGIKGTLTVSP